MNSAESALVGHLFEKWTMKRIYNPNCLCKLFNSKPRCLQSLRLQTLEKIQFSSSLEDMIQSSRGHRGCHRDRFAEGRAHTHTRKCSTVEDRGPSTARLSPQARTVHPGLPCLTKTLGHGILRSSVIRRICDA